MGSKRSKKQREADRQRTDRLKEKTRKTDQNYLDYVTSHRIPYQKVEPRVLARNPIENFLILDSNSIWGPYTEESTKFVARTHGAVYIPDGVRGEIGREAAINLAKRLEGCHVDFGFLEAIEEPSEYTLPIRNPESGEVHHFELSKKDFRKVTPRNITFTKKGYDWNKRSDVWNRFAAERPPSPQDEEIIKAALSLGIGAKKAGKRLRTVYVVTNDKRHITDSYLSKHIQEEMGVFFGNPAEVFMELYGAATERGYEGTMKQKVYAAGVRELGPHGALHFTKPLKEIDVALT